MSSSPIADLTYRGYDGPLNSADRRWWAIAKMTMRLAIKRKGFWIWASLSAVGYVILMIVYYFADLSTASITDGKNPFLSSLVWRDQPLNGFGTSQLLLFIIALLIGVGQIANDNKANALLIYLSKPCTKLDYLMGKWLGIFVPIYLVALAPALIFWAYTAMSFRNYGSISSAPLLPLELVIVSAVPAFLLSSLSVGISSLFNNGRLAGATFAGVYFISNLFTHLMAGVYVLGENRTAIIRDLYYASVDGMNIGIAKLICNTDGSAFIPQTGSDRMVVGRPDALLILAGFFGISAISVLIAWLRIRPVEVVG